MYGKTTDRSDFFLGNTVVVSILCFWTSRSRWDELSV